MSTQEQASGFLTALFDFSFSRFITVKLIPVLYGLALIVASLGVLAMVGAGFTRGFMSGLFTLILAPLFFLFCAMYIRVILEVMIVLFRIAENVADIADRKAATGG